MSNTAPVFAHPSTTSPQPALAQIGRWLITAIPPGWLLHPGFGIWREAPSVAPPNICLTEDTLLAGRALAPYIAAQQTLLSRRFPNCAAVGPSPVPFPGAEEAMLLFLKHPPTNTSPAILQAQTYVRLDTWIGIVTVTSTEGEMPSIKPVYQSFLSTLRIA